MNHLFDLDANQLTESEKQIIDFFYKNEQVIPFLSINEISQSIGVSNATLTRFSKKVGFKSFKELKLSLVTKREATPSSKLQNALEFEETNELPATMIYRDIQQLLETLEQVDATVFQNAAQAIIEKERIFIFSKGVAQSLGHLLEFRLRRFGIQIQNINQSGSEIFETLHALKKTDLVILFCFSKTPRETQVVFDYAKKNGIETICFTDRLHPQMQQIATYPFYISRGNSNEYHSLTSTISFIDALIVAVHRLAPPSYHEQLEKIHQLKESYKKEIPR
ncbi:MAG: MurR/RpiR family transcriptional regulator [Enterococcus sp.]